MPVNAERTERPNEQQVGNQAPAGLESARSAAYGPRASFNQTGEQGNLPQNSQKSMLTGHIDFNDFGQLYSSTFDAALDQQERSMISAAFTGTALGICDVVIGAAKTTALAGDIAQDLRDTYFADNSQIDYSQKLVQDIEKINVKPALQAINHIGDVAQSHNQGQPNSGYLNFDTYKQIANETATVAVAAADAISKLDPATQIETGLRINSALLFSDMTGRAAGAVKDAVTDMNIAGKAKGLLNEAKEGFKELTAETALTTDGQLIKIPQRPEAEDFILRMARKERDHGFTRNFNGLEVTEQYRSELPAIINHDRNVAFSDVAINGVKERLVAVSGEKEIAGTVGMPETYTLLQPEELYIGAQIKEFHEAYPGITIVGEFAHV